MAFWVWVPFTTAPYRWVETRGVNASIAARKFDTKTRRLGVEVAVLLVHNSAAFLALGSESTAGDAARKQRKKRSTQGGVVGEGSIGVWKLEAFFPLVWLETWECEKIITSGALKKTDEVWICLRRAYEYNL